MKPIYLDNNATTRVAPEVREAMLPFFNEYWGNPSSMHTFGGQIKKYIDEAREKVAALINANPIEIVFTSCGSESNNTAIKGVMEAYEGHPHIITTAVEHPAVLSVCRYLKNKNYPLTELQVDQNGQINLDQLRASIRMDTGLISIMWANNETGVIFPIEDIAEIAAEHDKVLHTDAVQIAGKINIDVQKTPVDLLSISGHKLHTPKGIGALYIRRGTKLNSLITGGHQESGKRAGTENVPYIVGLGRACELAMANQAKESNRIAKLRDKLEAGILTTCPDVSINGDIENRLPNTTNISFKFIEGEAILLSLDELSICTSSGSACTSGSLEPSHVIRAMGVPFTSAHGSTRFSLSRYTTEKEIDYVLENIPIIIKRLRSLSPFCKN